MRKCADLVFVPPRFNVYRAVSQQIQTIFADYTSLIEPLSLDEAYLDVTQNKTGFATATLVARTIREQIRQELNLTASAGAPAQRRTTRYMTSTDTTPSMTWGSASDQAEKPKIRADSACGRNDPASLSSV